MKAIYIHKGDDTVFGEVSKFITATLKSKYDLTGYKGQFILEDIVLNFEDISSGKFEIILTDEETSRLEYGRHYGKIKVIDAEEHIKTVCNTILFIVTPEVIDTQNEIIELDLTNSPEYQLILQVGEDVVYSVNGQTGNVNLTAEDVGALPSDTFIPSKLSDLNNDEDFVNAESFAQGLDGKQDKGDYATREELEGKQDKGDYATREELDGKQDKGDYATREEVAQGFEGKQDKGDYALKDEIPDLTDYVKNTDYAGDVGGVIKISSVNGLAKASNGYLLSVQKTLEDYNSGGNSTFVSKGTLENIKDDYVKRGITANTIELTEDEKANAQAWLGYTTQSDINTAIANLPQFKISILDTLPETGEKMVLYLVPKDGEAPDVYNEYIWIEDTSSFEFLGSTAVDLTDYVKKTDYATGTVAGVVKASPYYGVITNSQGFLLASQKTLDGYDKGDIAMFIAKGTLENIKNNFVKEAITANDITLTDDEKTSARTWLGVGSQADLDTKANDSAVVHLAGSETITGVKTFTLPDNIKFQASKTSGYTPAPTNSISGLTPATNVPWSRNGWHDHFAFGQSFTVASKEVTTDGESWTSDDRDISYLFAQKEYGEVTVSAPNAGEIGFRFVLQGANIAYANIQWIEFGFAYTSSHTVRLLIETSPDGVEWTEVHNSTTGASATNKYLYVGNLSNGNTYLRVSVIKTDMSYLDAPTRVIYVKGWTTRKGNQGRGIEYEFPYFWDNIPNLMPVKSGNNLGSTTRRWGTTYTTNLNVGGQILNHTHITKLDNLPTIVPITEGEYEALETKDANTLYLIEEE